MIRWWARGGSTSLRRFVFVRHVRRQTWHRLFQKVFMRTTYPWIYVYFWWSRVYTALETVGRAPVFVWEHCLAWSLRWSDSSACSARTQGAMKTGPAPDKSPVSVAASRGNNPIRFWSMGPRWSQPYFMDLVRMGQLVLACPLKPRSWLYRMVCHVHSL